MTTIHAQNPQKFRMRVSYSLVFTMVCLCLLTAPLYLEIRMLTSEKHFPKVTIVALEGHSDILKSNVKVAGSYQYKGTPACQRHTCTLHFPQLLEDENTIPKCVSTDACIATQKGHKSNVYNGGLGFMPNQDRSLLLSPLALIPSTTHADDFLIMLADGHGEKGEDSAEAALLDLPVRLLAALSSRDSLINLTELFSACFLQTDAGILSMIPRSGTTALVALKYLSTLFLVSAGDSTAFVAIYDSKTRRSKIKANAVKHKPADPTERKRIEAHGGTVWIPPDGQGESSRVLLENGALALAMSRSLGDIEGKRNGVLTAEPSIVRVELSSDELAFVVVASDGVTDLVPIEEIAQTLAQSLYGRGPTLPFTVQKIMNGAAERWNMATSNTYRDDMTIIVRKL